MQAIPARTFTALADGGWRERVNHLKMVGSNTPVWDDGVGACYRGWRAMRRRTCVALGGSGLTCIGELLLRAS